MKGDPWAIARELGKRAAQRGDGAQCCPYQHEPLAKVWKDARREEKRRIAA